VLEPSKSVSGWVAVSEMRMEFGDPDRGPGDYRWLDRYTPVRRVGKSIRLYRVDVESRAAAAK
jgi:hypothetical protein